MLQSWRDDILKEFAPQVSRLTLVADPDGLFAEEGVLQGIRERGFDLLPFEDPVAFRFAYESRYRSRWDRGETADLVVVVRGGLHELDRLPYDLLQVGRKLSVGLADLFPSLSYAVVAALDRADLDALYDAQSSVRPGKLGNNATRDYVLRHVFDIDVQAIDQPSELLRALLRRHYQGRRTPHVLDERLIQALRAGGRFADWPLETIVPDRAAFLSFVQERWPIYLDQLAAREGSTLVAAREGRVIAEAPAYVLEHAGPSDLPFDDDDVRAYVDSLFLDDLLRPVTHRAAEALSDHWVVVGLQTDPAADRLRRLQGLLHSVESALPSATAKHQEWLDFAYPWARLIVARHELDGAEHPDIQQRFLSLRAEVDATFLAWVKQRYSGLHNLPPHPPAMLSHIPRALASLVTSPERRKVAIVILDGLALDQWVVLHEVLRRRQGHLRYSEGAVFAWAPTITSVSRQSIFAGSPPLYYPQSVFTTDREAVLWTRFWSEHGLSAPEVAYAKGLGEDASLSIVQDALSHPKLHVVGFVVDMVDKIMHGMKLGTAGMHNQVRQWADGGFLAALVDLMVGRGFEVYLTSDHGNVEATGIGRPAEGALSEIAGTRARVYADETLRSQVGQRFPDALAWPPIGLPENFLALLAPNRAAFTDVGKRLVGHGGITIEELIVPYIHVESRSL